MAPLSPELYFRALLWLLAILLVQGLLLLLVCAGVQVHWERAGRTRAHYQALWEQAMLAYLYGGARDVSGFGPIGPRERRLLIPFLLKVLGTVGGKEGEAVRALYYKLALYKGLNARLQSRKPQSRALAALEVGVFRAGGYTRTLLDLLEDPTHHVAHVAAQGLADTKQLDFAEPVYAWVMTQDLLQPGRQLELLERFGPGFMRWLEGRLDAESRLDQRAWIIYAQLAASGRGVGDPSRLLTMLQMDDVEALAAAIRALGSLGLPEAGPPVLAFAGHPSWVVRALAATTIGHLCGHAGIGVLLDLTADPVFTVRHNAALALLKVGPQGVAAMEWLAEDPDTNPFAPELTRERLQWLEFGLRP